MKFEGLPQFMVSGVPNIRFLRQRRRLREYT